MSALSRVAAAGSLDVWSVVGVAAGVASAVAAAVSIALVLWFRYRDRPGADWLLTPLNFMPGPKYDQMWARTNKGKPSESISLTNVGDGAAYRLQAEGIGCTVMLYAKDDQDVRGYQTPSAIAVLRTGESVGIFIWHDDADQRSSERVTITWRESPTRWHKGRSTVDFPQELRALQDKFELEHPNK